MERNDFLKIAAFSFVAHKLRRYNFSNLELGSAGWEQSGLLNRRHIYELNKFMGKVSDGSKTLKGVYSPDNFAFPVVPQPEGKPEYISGKANTVTLFRRVEGTGNHGVLAHNTIAGKDFYKLDLNDLAVAVRGDKKPFFYRMFDIRQFETISQKKGKYFDLRSKKELSASDIVDDIYLGKSYASEYRLTLQTCLEKNSNKNWGLSFFIGRHISPELFRHRYA